MAQRTYTVRTKSTTAIPVTPNPVRMRNLVSALDRLDSKAEQRFLSFTDKQEITHMLRQHDGVLKYVDNCNKQGTTPDVKTIVGILS